MPISLAIVACGCGLIYFGTRGFTDKGIRFSPKTTLKGSTAKVVGTICIICGVGMAITGAVLVVLVGSRTNW